MVGSSLKRMRPGHAARMAGTLLAETLRLIRERGPGAVHLRQLPVRIAIGYLMLPWRPTEQLGRALQGDARVRLGASVSAWNDFSGIRSPRVIARIARRYFPLAFENDPSEAYDLLERMIRLGAHRRWNEITSVSVAKAAFAAGHEGLAQQIVDYSLPRAPAGSMAESELRRLSTWLEGGEHRVPEPTVPADVRFGLLDYRQPGHESTNIGDYTQTLASLGHLLRHENLTFVGEPELLRLVAELKTKVKAERRISSQPASVQVMRVHRDASTYQKLPEDLWTLVFGWYMHPNHGHYSFPMHPNVRPIFVSFHVSHTDMLTSDAIEYLKRWGPVGCRDWQTVATLLALDVPAFFSGCITTTVDTLFPSPEGNQRGSRVACIDVSDTWVGDDELSQLDSAVLHKSFAANLRLAYARVLSFQTDFSSIITSRLHAYLPALSVGSDVRFIPDDPRDVRFSGLGDLDQQQLDDMRVEILEKIAPVLTKILSNSSPEEVYELWRDTCQPEVERARSFFQREDTVSEPDSLPDLADILGRPRLGSAVLIPIEEISQRELARLLRALDRFSPPDVAFLLLDNSAEAFGQATLRRVLTARVGYSLTPGDIVSGGDLNQAMVALLNAPAAEQLVVLDEHTSVQRDLAPLFQSDCSNCAGVVLDGASRGIDELRRIASGSAGTWEEAVRFEFALRRADPGLRGRSTPMISTGGCAGCRLWTEYAGLLRGLSTSDALTVCLRRYAENPAGWSADPLLVSASEPVRLLDLATLRRHSLRQKAPK